MGMEGASLRCPSSLNKTTGGHETDRAAAVQLCLLCTSRIHGYKQSTEQRRGAGGAAGMLEERSSGFCLGMEPTAPSPGLDPPPGSVLHHWRETSVCSQLCSSIRRRNPDPRKQAERSHTDRTPH